MILLRQVPDVVWILASQSWQACQSLIGIIVLHEADMIHLAWILEAVNRPFFPYLISVSEESVEKRQVIREIIGKPGLILDIDERLWTLARSEVLKKLTSRLFEFFEAFLLLYV